MKCNLWLAVLENFIIFSSTYIECFENIKFYALLGKSRTLMIDFRQKNRKEMVMKRETIVKSFIKSLTGGSQTRCYYELLSPVYLKMKYFIFFVRSKRFIHLIRSKQITTTTECKEFFCWSFQNSDRIKLVQSALQTNKHSTIVKIFETI